MAQIGLEGQLSAVGFASNVYRACLRKIADATRREEWHNAFEEIKSWSEGKDGQLAYPEWKGELADTLLKPWQSVAPSEKLKRSIIDFLRGHVGDPRIQEANWAQMRSAAEIMKRWLTEQALQQFFDIVDQIAYKKQWKYRKAFWSAWHRQGLIGDAWVVFGPNGADRARQAFGNHTGFGVLVPGGGKQYDAGHAVLLMRIGRALVADWSHNGKCYIWAANDTNQPTLYRRTYNTSEIQNTRREGISHVAPEHYTWQRKVAEVLLHLVGKAPKEGDYKVR
jgi:hypothetical protein